MSSQVVQHPQRVPRVQMSAADARRAFRQRLLLGNRVLPIARRPRVRVQRQQANGQPPSVDELMQMVRGQEEEHESSNDHKDEAPSDHDASDDNQNDAADDQNDGEGAENESDAMEVVEAKQPCPIPYEVLVEPHGRFRLAYNASCVCGVSVRSHHSQYAVRPNQRKRRDEDDEIDLSNDDKAKEERELQRIDKSVLTITKALSGQLPFFRAPNEEHPSVQPFLDEFARLLSPFEATLPKQHWYRIIPSVLSKCSRADADLIDKSIVQHKLDWPQLQEAIHILFDKNDYKSTLADEFNSISQRPGETMRAYINRFKSLLNQLGYDLNTPTLPSTFLNGLRPAIRAEYDRQRRLIEASSILANGSAGLNAAGHPPLDRIMAVCLEVEKNAGSDRHSNDYAKPSGPNDRRRNQPIRVPLAPFLHGMKPRDSMRVGHEPNDKCYIHPKANHTNLNCYQQQRQKSAREHAQHQLLKRRGDDGQEPNAKRPAPVCYTCGKPGHIAPNCPDKPNQEKNDKGRGMPASSGPNPAAATAYPRYDWGNQQRQNGAVKARNARLDTQNSGLASAEREDDDVQEQKPAKKVRFAENHPAQQRSNMKVHARRSRLSVIDSSSDDSDQNDSDQESD